MGGLIVNAIAVGSYFGGLLPDQSCDGLPLCRDVRLLRLALLEALLRCKDGEGQVGQASGCGAEHLACHLHCGGGRRRRGRRDKRELEEGKLIERSDGEIVQSSASSTRTRYLYRAAREACTGQHSHRWDKHGEPCFLLTP